MDRRKSESLSHTATGTHTNTHHIHATSHSHSHSHSRSNSNGSLTSNTSSEYAPMREYCERKLLHLSPILGFAKKDYFNEHNISDDNIVHILSFIKPNEYYKSIVKLSKHFEKIIKHKFEPSNICMEKSSVKDYIFTTFNQIEENYFKKERKVDLALNSRLWQVGILKSYDSTHSTFVVKVDNFTYNDVWTKQMAPYGTMTHRPANLFKLRNILSKGLFKSVFYTICSLLILFQLF